MKDKPKVQFNYILWLVVLPVVVLAAVAIAVTLIAYSFDKGEFEPTDTRGDDVLEMGLLDDPCDKWFVDNIESNVSEPELVATI